MKKFLVIGNPIDHSLSPKLHNYWINENNIKALYEKRKLNGNDLRNLISQVKEKNIDGINVTVPFKREVIPFLDQLTDEAETEVNEKYNFTTKDVYMSVLCCACQHFIFFLKYSLSIIYQFDYGI